MTRLILIHTPSGDETFVRTNTIESVQKFLSGSAVKTITGNIYYAKESPAEVAELMRKEARHEES